MSIYVCSDIHGQYGLFKAMLQDTGFSDSDTLYVLGDIIDRGPESIPMFLDIMGRGNVRCLMGNHELMMYEYFRKDNKKGSWLLEGNGGQATKEQFDRLGKDLQEHVLDFMEDMLLQEEVFAGEKTFLLSHSDFLSDKSSVLFRDAGHIEAFKIVWHSPWRFWEYVPETKYAEDGRFHIIGHVPVQLIKTDADAGSAYVNTRNRLANIDLGCASLESADPLPGAGLCCMDLGKFAEGDTDGAFRYYRPQ